MFAGSLVVVAGGLVVGAGVMGWLGKLPRNPVAGVRTRAAMRSERAFAEANRVAAPWIAAGGSVAVVGGVLALLAPRREALVLMLVALLGMAAFVIIGGIRGSRSVQDS